VVCAREAPARACNASAFGGLSFTPYGQTCCCFGQIEGCQAVGLGDNALVRRVGQEGQLVGQQARTESA